MALDFSALVQNDFYKKKMRRAVEVRDGNRDGYITQTDFDIMVERCKNLDSSTPKHLERLTQHMKETCDFFGLVDDSVKYTYSEFLEKWFDILKEWFPKGVTEKVDSVPVSNRGHERRRIYLVRGVDCIPSDCGDGYSSCSSLV